MKKCIYFVLLALSVYSCVEPYEPEVGEYDSTLVVDGIFTDGEDTSTVLLSRSYAYSGGAPELVVGATVAVEDEQGNRIEFTETSPGKYQNDPAVVSGRAGVNYRLLVITPEGNQFESDWETLKSSPPIKDVYYQYEERERDNPDLFPFKGIQLYLDTEDTENNTRFYRWEYVETYRYGLTYPPLLIPKFGNPPARGRDTIFEIPLNELEGYRCWKSVESTKIFIASTESFSQDKIEGYPLLYVNNRTPRLYLRYSLLVRQYAISEDYYEYLRTIEATNQTTGSLFDPIPNEIFGNVHSSDGRDIPVLGYFGVAGSNSKRIFINRDELPMGLNPPYGPDCSVDTLAYNLRDLYNEIRYSGKLLYNYSYDLFGNPNGYQVTTPECARCSALGATNIEPEFW
ncbi:DUF4249 domain-containing protein [Flavilitoribacter nigricans]|uniref:DUF4249 domain-containing protein n=1 Tax=Flavilitoribacter nigricans (strain ATCC 23147 / DSM 23189 / NBRC 102662 / NCIMB 1420 / SS-2) TaxID=1122177 RepID=A0A2D0N532_FLAN2|nr:DUF4249 domain-containing protein [Flavilitoribacter nigricans]PHN03547.1 hypothetical protein CRP01_26475 [Flavilitoribacter nigricans DSM 23189 = NBRC 102662]